MTLFPSSLQDRLHRGGVIAVLILEDARDAVSAARALVEGGVGAMELTLRTPAALEALRLIRAEVPEMIAGAGTILMPRQVDEAIGAGAAFGVAPGFNPRVVEHALGSGLPFAPGVCTPTDVELALESGCKLMKLFPAEPCGGLPYLRAISAPFAHCGARFIPLGGIGPANAEAWLREPSVAALGGSWLAPREVVAKRDWHAITTAAREAAALVRRVRPSD
ncbi:MAG TPA: keto-deoxy-phosphogluconate aldolase [Verrucomicrobiales bacterium]|nr:keto-deoxy-phosphogluconate aldolase [Verrucomicrobiales bacterium]